MLELVARTLQGRSYYYFRRLNLETSAKIKTKFELPKKGGIYYFLVMVYYFLVIGVLFPRNGTLNSLLFIGEEGGSK